MKKAKTIEAVTHTHTHTQIHLNNIFTKTVKLFNNVKKDYFIEA